MAHLIAISLSVALLLAHIIAADETGYQEPVQCQADSDCPAPTCDPNRGWVRSFCGAGGTCQNEANDCNDHVSCTMDSCDPSKGCQHDTTKCGCTDDGQCYDWNPCTTDICFNRICRHEAIAGCCLDHDDCDVGFRCRAGMCARTKDQINSTCERIAERLMRCCTTVAKQPNSDGSVTVVNLCKDYPYDPEEDEEPPADIDDVRCWSANGTVVSGNALLGKEIYWYNNNFNINNNNNCKITIILEN